VKGPTLNDPNPVHITEWGDEIPLRPEGCPVCHYSLIPTEASKCYQCGAEFAPLVRGPSARSQGNRLNPPCT